MAPSNGIVLYATLLILEKHNFILMADTDGNIWRDAFEKNFAEQTLINNVVKEIANSISRNIGWMALEYILYGGENVLT